MGNSPPPPREVLNLSGGLWIVDVQAAPGVHGGQALLPPRPLPPLPGPGALVSGRANKVEINNI